MRINSTQQRHPVNPGYDTKAPKKSANLSINSSLLEAARALNINLSATLERSLIERIREKQQALWLSENQQAIDSYNQMVESEGSFSDGLRHF